MNYFFSGISALKSRFITHSPIWLTHVVTYKCNAKCEMCGRNQKKNDRSKELTKQECFELLENAKKAGIVSYTMYGGEPLLRQDIPEILSYAKQLGLYVILNTNGYYLVERFAEIAPFVNSLIVSLDAADSKHDEMRGIPNLLNRAIAGIQKYQGKAKISINSVITKQNLNSAKGLAQLANSLNIPVFIQSMVVVPDTNEHLALSKEEETNLYLELKLLKINGYKILNSYSYLDNLLKGNSSRCHAPKVFIRIEGDGSIVFCSGSYWGNIREKSLKTIFSGKEFQTFCKKMENCSKCASACTDITHLYDNPLYLFKLLKNYL